MNRVRLIDALCLSLQIAWRNRKVGVLTLAVAAGPLITLVYHLTRSEDAQVGSFSLAQGVRGILCLAMFTSLWHVRRFGLLEHPLMKPLMVLAGYAVLMAIVSPYPYENIAFAVKVSFLGLVFAIAFHLSEEGLCGEQWLTACAWMVLLFMVVSQMAGFALGNTLKMYRSTYATAGLIDQASITAAYSISAVPIMLSAFPDQRLSLVGVVAQLACVFFTMRRTELIAAVLALGVVVCFALAPLRRRIPWRGTAAAVIAIGSLVAFALSTPVGADFLARLEDLDPSTGTGSGRYLFWRIGWDHAITRALDAQVLGDGVGAVRDVMYREFGLFIGCHSDWLDMMNSFGLVGLAVFGWWYLTFLRFVIVAYRADHPAFRGVLSAFVMLSVVSFGTGGIFDPSFVVVYAALGCWAAQPLWNESYEYAECAAY